MKSSCPAPSIRLLLVGALLCAANLIGCSRVGGDATQVAAKVNDTEISLSQLQHVLQRQPAAPAERADTQARRALEGIIDQELAAQAARQQGLDKDPRIVQALEAAKREMLARAYQDTVSEKAALPSSDEVDRYYDSQPALFSQRRYYTLQEMAVEGTPEQLIPLQKRVAEAIGAARVSELLRESHLRFTSRQITVSPEDVPLALLGKLAEMREGQSVMLAQPAAARVLTVVSVTPAPLTREAARPAIQVYLTNEHKRQTVLQALKETRESARIEYRGKFAQAASQPAAGFAASSPQ
jgi:EpsD family peptidyl-prolyl cis-trans isomerase